MTGAAEQVLRVGSALVRHLAPGAQDRAAQPAGARHSGSGWAAVTVLCAAEDLDEAAPPAPLAELGNRIEVRVRPAADDKGTELAARLRDRPAGASRTTAAHRLAGEDPEAELRSALRRAKQLLEVGEVLAVDWAPHGERPATPAGGLLESWTRSAAGGGVR